jgi:hypothetical protein
MRSTTALTEGVLLVKGAATPTIQYSTVQWSGGEEEGGGEEREEEECEE